jgi:hypothetical protein
MPRAPSDSAARARRPSWVRLAALAAPIAAIALHALLAFGVLSQPLDVGRAAPGARAPTWRLFNDSAHRSGPGADLFAVYRAAVASRRGEPLYTRVDSAPGVPYFFPFRYLPIVADTLGRALARLEPRAAFVAWGVLLEALLAAALAFAWRAARTPGERAFGVALLALSTPYLLELHMGQLTFAAAALATAAALTGERPVADRPGRRWRGAALRTLEGAALALGGLLKMFPIIALPLWAKRGRLGIFASASLAVGALALAGFFAHPADFTAFLDANVGAPEGGLGTGNVGPLYAAFLIARRLGCAASDADLLGLAPLVHACAVGLTLAVVLLSREKRLWAGVAALAVAHFVGYVHVWEHHMSAVLLVGAVVWLKRRELGAAPGRLWSGLAAAALVLLALPTPFALLDPAPDPSVWDAGAGWSLGAKLAVAGAKALPLVLLWGLLLAPFVRSGLALPWRRVEINQLASALVALAAMIAFLSAGSDGVLCGFPLDDAWIHRVYARSVAFGHGFQYNVGADEAGATSPLWIVVSAPAEWLGALSVDAVAFAVKAIAALLAALFVAGVLAVSRAAMPGAGTVLTALPAVVVAADPRLAFSSLSGMENALVAALWIWAVFAAQRGRYKLFAVLVALLPTARPEAALLLPAAWGVVLFARGPSRPRKAALLGVTLVPAALWVAFCLRTTGHPLPNTFYVKAIAGGDAVEIARNTFRATTSSGYASTLAFGLGLLGFGALLCAQGRKVAIAGIFLLAAPFTYAIAVSASRAVRLDGYYWTRWYDPPAALLSAASAIGLAQLFLWSLRAARRGIAGRIAIAIAAALCAQSAYALARDAAASRAQLASDIAVIERMNVAAGKWVERHAGRDQVVGAHDAGAVKYFGARPTIDFGGLNTHALAFDWRLAQSALARSSLLVVFPKRLAGTGALDGFEEVASFSVPEAEYTICDCPLQTELGVYARSRRSGSR